MPHRMLLVAPAALAERLEKMEWSNRRLAKYAECAPGTIDNLMNGKTKGLNNPRTAELICEATSLPLSLIFMPEASSNASRSDSQQRAVA